MKKAKFRPCIDLHNGEVKQIIGGTLSENKEELQTNFVSKHPAEYYAQRYRNDKLTGGHVIKLGPGNDDAARAALSAYPKGLQIGGGVTLKNASDYLEAGASHVIVTSSLFQDAKFSLESLKALSQEVGAKNLVVDLSCRRVAVGASIKWMAAMDRWQTLTNLEVSRSTLDDLAEYCDEFLIHAADVEGMCQGVDEELISLLGQWGRKPITYAGGARNLGDLRLVDRLGQGNIDLTIGSALDIFGGAGVTYDECLRWNQQ